MRTHVRELLEQAAGTPDMPVDPEAAMRRGDRLRRRRQLAAGAVASVLVIGAAGLAMQLPGDVPIPEVAGQDETVPGDPQDDEGSPPDHPELQPDDFQEIATGHLDDGRPWSAQAAHITDYLCVRFSIADRELVDNCSPGADHRRDVFASHLADRPGGADVTVGYVGGDWHAPVEVEFHDATTTEADLHPIDGSTLRFFLAQHGDQPPTHLVVRDENGDPQRLALRR